LKTPNVQVLTTEGSMPTIPTGQLGIISTEANKIKLNMAIMYIASMQSNTRAYQIVLAGYRYQLEQNSNSQIGHLSSHECNVKPQMTEACYKFITL
jgi:hypothetical protein